MLTFSPFAGRFRRCREISRHFVGRMSKFLAFQSPPNIVPHPRRRLLHSQQMFSAVGDVFQVRDHIAATPARIQMRTLFRGRIRIDNVWQTFLKFCAGHCSFSFRKPQSLSLCYATQPPFASALRQKTLQDPLQFEKRNCRKK
jgi:hypothetical protein